MGTTYTLELTKEELDFICSSISEIHSLYNEDGVIELSNETFREQMVQNLATKLENLI